MQMVTPHSILMNMQLETPNSLPHEDHADGHLTLHAAADIEIDSPSQRTQYHKQSCTVGI